MSHPPFRPTTRHAMLGLAALLIARAAVGDAVAAGFALALAVSFAALALGPWPARRAGLIGGMLALPIFCWGVADAWVERGPLRACALALALAAVAVVLSYGAGARRTRGRV